MSAAILTFQPTTMSDAILHEISIGDLRARQDRGERSVLLDVREGDWRLGVLFSSWGVGVLVASLLMPRLVRRLGAARVTLLAMPASALLCARCVVRTTSR